MTRARDLLDANYWRSRGFSFDAAQRELIERFFSRWHEVYGRPGTGAFRSQDALFAVHEGFVRLYGEQTTGRAQRTASSVLRAGYTVGAVERDLGYRNQADPNLQEIFRLIGEEHPEAATEGLARAILNGHWVGGVVEKMVIERPDVALTLDGFALREAVFVELRDTLLVKLRVSSRCSVDTETSVTAMRWGHAVAVAEESLPTTMALS